MWVLLQWSQLLPRAFQTPLQLFRSWGLQPFNAIDIDRAPDAADPEAAVDDDATAAADASKISFSEVERYKWRRRLLRQPTRRHVLVVATIERVQLVF